MFALFKKEIAGFFSGITGYVVILIFLISTGLFIWIVPGGTNIFDAGYATLDPFFLLAPWVFMFLIPAITMRQFTDEQKTGTIELLLTRPLSDLDIVLAKYFSALTIGLIAILPTVTYFASIYLLGNPVGNLDIGGTWGSYIGLIFLAAGYAAIGIFTSALSNNQVVAFVLSVVLVFVFYFGFDAFSSLFANNKAEFILQNLSISRHYQSLSRGVIDTRDIMYFIALIVIFIQLTKFKLQSRKW